MPRLRQNESWDTAPKRKGKRPPKKRSQAADFKLGGRTRGIARSALGRVYIHEGSVYLVKGDPDPIKLAEFLVGLKQLPKADDPPSPISLGFAASDISRIAEKELAEYANALQRWRHQLDKHASSKHRTGAVRRQQDEWQAEIVTISEQIGFLRALLSNPNRSSGDDWGCYCLPRTEQRRVGAAIASCTGSRHLPPLWKLYVVLAAWIRDAGAAERILKTLSPHLLLLNDHSLRNILLAVKRGAHESLPLRYTLGKGGKHKKDEYVPGEPCVMTRELQTCLDGLPDSMFGPGPGLIPPPPRRRRDLPDYLKNLLPVRCDVILKKLAILPDHVAASIAAIHMSVDTEVELLAEVFRNCEKPFADNCLQLLGKLRPHFGGKGLAPLIKYLLTIPKDLMPGDIEPIGQLLAAGESLEDVIFLTRVGNGERWRLSEVLAGLRKKKIPLRPLAELGRGLKSKGADLRSKDLLDIAEETCRIGHTKVLNAFNSMMGMLEGEAFTPRLAEAMRASAVEAAKLANRDDRLRAKLELWATPPRSLPAMPGRPEDLPPDVALWLDRTAYYHALTGQKTEIPAAFTKLLSTGSTSDRELAFLHQQQADGKLTEPMARRLQLLESRGQEAQSTPGAKLLRKAKQGCALAALGAIKHMAEEEAKRTWGAVVGALTTELPFDQMNTAAKWFGELHEKEQTAIRLLLKAHQQNTHRYKESFPANAEWLEKARLKGLNVEAWLYPPAIEAECESMRVRMEVSTDPCQVFLMGSYFDTCLSIEDGCNRNAVIANAADANKAVLYLKDASGHVLGRKLLCVTDDLGLLGYQTYRAEHDRARRTSLGRAVDAYCGSWARRAGLTLVNTGEPRSLFGLFWYDDGADSWSADAHRAWLQGGEFSLTIADSKLHPRVREAVIAREGDCLRYLASMGIAPAGAQGDPAGLLDDGELAEEALGNLAAIEADEGLAQLLADCAWGESARVDALLLLGRIRGDRFVDEMLSRLPGGEVDRDGYHRVSWECADRAARTLFEIGTILSYRRLFELVLDGAASSIWLQLAASRPQQALEAMHEAAADRTFDWGFEPPAHIVLFVDAVRHAASSESLSRLASKIITHQCLGSWGVFAWRSQMIQWLGRLLLDRAVSPDLFESVCADYRDEWEREHCEPITDPEEFVTGSLLALCKPGSAATRYLRDAALKSPAALLALALSCPQRYADFITERALATPMSCAAGLALWVAKGPSEGRRLLEEAWLQYPGHLRMIDRVDRLFRTYTRLDFEHHEEIIGHLDCNATRECLPLLVGSIWRHMAEVERGALPLRLPRTEAGRGAVMELKLPLSEVSGLACLLARLMRQAEGDRLRDLRGALRDILQLHWGASWEMVIALDMVSGGAVMADEELGKDGWRPRDTDLPAQMGDLLLLTPDGTETGLARSLGRRVEPRWVRSWSIPPDPVRAKRLMAILRKRQPKVLEDKAVAPHSEIGRRLFKLYAEWAIPVDEDP